MFWRLATVTRERDGQLARDRGLCRRARTGEITSFTGVSSSYELPGHIQPVVDTGAGLHGICAVPVMSMMCGRGVVRAPGSVRP